MTPAMPAGPSGGPRPPRRVRDRRGHGQRGPSFLPGPLTPGGVPAHRSRRDRFDDLVLDVVEDIESRWHRELGEIEYAVEDTPLVPDDWDPETVPLASLVPAEGSTPTRLVVFRRPIEHRCETLGDLRAMVHMVVVEQVSELLGIPAEEVDPRYDPE